MAPRETENNAYAKKREKERALWYVIVFSGVVNTLSFFPRLQMGEQVNTSV